MKDKVALVIGGSGGIGAEVSKKLAEEKYYVYINCRKEEKGRKVLNEIVKSGGQGQVLVFDITSEEELEYGISRITSDKIDVLVNNAGILKDDIIFNINIEDWKSVFHTNFTSAVSIYKAVEKKLNHSCSPKVINLCSISGIRPRKGQLSYGLSKSMLIAWTSAIAEANSHIVYFSLSPGPVETDLIKGSKWYGDSRSLKRIPLERYAEPDEIAEFIVFLSENPGLFKNGSNIVLDGGFLQTTKE